MLLGDYGILMQISIHAPSWGATARNTGCYQNFRFQSTHPHGVRPDAGAIIPPTTLFQSTHPCGVRQSETGNTPSIFVISIHAPSWGATIFSERNSPFLEFQSTHPRGVRLPGRQFFGLQRMISIHAPSWGATLNRKGMTPHGPISIHAPSWGATDNPAADRAHFIFQSTHPRGVRRTSTRSAFSKMNFNPRTLVGCDWGSSSGNRRKKNFNPRTLVGCDIQLCFIKIISIISIHAPSWGATGKIALTPVWKIFQSTHPRGVRPFYKCRNDRAGTISIHAPSWGATQEIRDRINDLQFQSTHPRGVRHLLQLQKDVRSGKFQSTHPRGVRLGVCGVPSSSRRMKYNKIFSTKMPWQGLD